MTNVNGGTSIHIYPFFFLLHQPVRKSAISNLSMCPRPDSQNAMKTAILYCLKELPQVTIPRKIPFSLYLFMMNPDGICRHQVYSPGFHLIQLFLPSSIGNPTVMNLAHQGKPWSIVQRQKLRCIRQFRISVPLYSHVLSTSYAPADRRVCSIYYGFQQ